MKRCPFCFSAILGAALMVSAPCLAQQNSVKQDVNKQAVSKALKSLENNDYSPVEINTIAEANAIQAVPLLEARFEDAKDETSKGKIASALVKLKVDNPMYWDYLVGLIKPVVEEDIPYQIASGSDESPSKEFKEWAQEHHLTMNEVAERQFEYAGRVLFIASSQDPRARYWLVKALGVHDYVIQAFAARGLALLKDKDSIPAIIKACASAPADSAPAIATALVYFDDPLAELTAPEYLKKDYIAALREGRSKGQGPFN